MRDFEVLVCMRIAANSFADAERKAQAIMVAGFNDTKGESPSEFATLNILKMPKIRGRHEI